MMTYVVGRGLVAAVKGVVAPLRWLSGVTDILAGVKRGEEKHLVRVDLVVTGEEFDRLSKNEDFARGWAEAHARKSLGMVESCPTCGAGVGLKQA